MTTEQIIRGLREILFNVELIQDDVEIICAAIRALGGRP